MTNPISDDLREYYFSADAEEVVLDTIELRHPAFVDENQNPVAVRFVNDPDDLIATLEANAPMNAGEQVTFLAGRFSVRPPDQDPPAMPTVDIEVENVSRELMPYMEAATADPAPIQLTYRQYLASDPSMPGLIIGGLTIKKGTAGLLRVTATAGYEDFVNMPFPSRLYTRQEFPGLDR